jgi:hypothetical protein
VATVIENREDLSVEDAMEQFYVSREQIAAVLDFVAEKPQGVGASAFLGRRCSPSWITERRGASSPAWRVTPW